MAPHAKQCLSVATPTLQKRTSTQEQAKYLQQCQLMIAGTLCLTSYTQVNRGTYSCTAQCCLPNVSDFVYAWHLQSQLQVGVFAQSF